MFISREKIYRILEVSSCVEQALRSSISLNKKKLEELLLQARVIMLKVLPIVVTSLKLKELFLCHKLHPNLKLTVWEIMVANG